MKTMFKLTPARWLIKNCNGCADTSPHSHHLSWWGHLWLRQYRDAGQ